jgi:hypothetical protein
MLNTIAVIELQFNRYHDFWILCFRVVQHLNSASQNNLKFANKCTVIIALHT